MSLLAVNMVKLMMRSFLQDRFAAQQRFGVSHSRSSFIAMVIAEWHKLVVDVIAAIRAQANPSRRPGKPANQGPRDAIAGFEQQTSRLNRMEIVMEKAEPAAEPPSCLLPPIFMIGRDSSGNWVAQEKSGARGGLFISRAEALKFAKFESGDYPLAVLMVSDTLELDTSSATARAGALEQSAINRQQQRRAA